jgi:parallel beta-helix repeat protein
MRRFLLIIFVVAAVCRVSFGQVNFPATITLPFLNSNDYKFTRTCGSGATVSGCTLTASTPATVTLAPFPRGLAAANYVYVSGGTGTAEAIAITSKTSTSITFTPANNHSGAWAVTSATDGIQEAVQYTAGGAVIVPSGTHDFYAEVKINDSVDLSGQDKDDTNLRMWIAGANGLAIYTSRPVTIRNFTITTKGGITKTGGGGIYIYAEPAQTLIENNIISYQYYGIWAAQCTQTTIRKNYIVSSVVHGVYFANSANTDGGDSTIEDCVIDSPDATGAAIFYESAGGLRVLNNKLFRHAYAIDLTLLNAVTTSVFIISNNSIEAFTTKGIRLQQGGATGLFVHINISDNEISGLFPVLDIGDVASKVIVNGNIFASAVDQTGIALACDGLIFSNNILYTMSVGINGNGCTNCSFLNNYFDTVTTRYSNVSAVKISDFVNATAFAALPTSANGSSIYCSDCTVTSGSDNTAAGSGNGSVVFRLNGAWRAFNNQN